MKILSIQVGLPKTVKCGDHSVTTAIFKSPITGSVRVNTLNIEGDKQADLRVHGGKDKAVYGFSYDTYPWWKANRPGDIYDFGAFGENLTIDSLPEDRIYLGDTFEMGTAALQVTQPRFPCQKLAVKFNDPTILRTFMKSYRPGIYFRVLREGVIATGDELKLVDQETIRVPVLELFLLSLRSSVDLSRVREILRLKSLNPGWREKLQGMLGSA